MVTYVSGLGKVDNRICMVLDWTLGRPEEARLLQDRSSLLQRQSASQGNMGDSEPPDILCESCACIIHTNIRCMSIISETLHDHAIFPSHLKRASEIPSYQLLGT